MNWIQKLWARSATKRRPPTTSPNHPKDVASAERDAKRRAEIAVARSEAFAGPQRLPLSHVLDPPSIDDLVELGVGYDDRLIVASSSADPDRTYAGRDESPGSASFPHSAAAERYVVEVLTLGADGTSTTMTIKDVPVAHPFVQPMPDGRTLLVGARARFADGEAEQNAWLVSSTGAIVGSFCAGDGIQSVQVSDSGRVWIGYFDEGVFGNFGWGRPDSPAPIGQAGLICWSSNGDLLYEFSAPNGFGPIDDCYAMSVVGDDAWACYYSDFPVVRVDASLKATGWRCGVGGAHAIVVGLDERVGLIGGYGGLFDRLVITELRDGEATPSTTYQLVMPDGSDLPSDARVVARGRYVNVLIEERWLRLDIEDLPRF